MGNQLKLLRFSPYYGIAGGFGEIRKGQKPVRYELVKRIAVSTPPVYHNLLIPDKNTRIYNKTNKKRNDKRISTNTD